MIKKQVIYFIIYFYIIYYIFHHAKHQQYKRNYDDEKKKPLHSVKYDTKNFLKKLYWSGNNVLFNKKSKIYFVLLYEIIFE